MKKLLITLICALCLFGNLNKVQAEEELDITAQFALAIDVTQDSVLYQKNADKKMYPASMTKIATVIVALEMIDDLNKTTTITQNDLETLFETGASAAHFSVGENVTYKDLIYGAMLPSGADATRALAFNLCGNLETYVEKMNALATKLNLKGTHFVNTTGIHDDNHYTTPNDLAKLLKYALQNKDFKEAFSTRSYTSSDGLHDWINTGTYYPELYGIDTSIIIGCKSGYTQEASNCLASLIKVDNREIITIVGHCNHELKGATMIDTNKIAQYCQDNYELATIFKKGEVVKSVDVTFADDKYQYISEEEIVLYLPKDYAKTDLTYKLPTNLVAPIKKNAKIGEFSINYKNKVLYQKELVNNKDISRNQVSYYLHQISKNIFAYIIGAILTILIVVFVLVRIRNKIIRSRRKK